ncbi:MAG: hypothetical protein JO148_06615 [Acidimicrobiia bacterium]|nr:hypothetical protein [Acidimicrobiia bacterium]
MRRAIRLGVLALVVAVAWAAAYGSPASALRSRRWPPKPPPTPSAPVQIGSTAALSAGNHTADVVLTLRCPSGATASPIKVFVRQNGVSGSGSATDYTCNGQPQHVVVPVTSAAGFHKGSAVASLSVSWHGSTSTKNNNSTSNVNANVSSAIQLV